MCPWGAFVSALCLGLSLNRSLSDVSGSASDGTYLLVVQNVASVITGVHGPGLIPEGPRQAEDRRPPDSLGQASPRPDGIPRGRAAL